MAREGRATLVQLVLLDFGDDFPAVMHYTLNDWHGLEQENTDEAIENEIARAGFKDRLVSWRRIDRGEYISVRAKRTKMEDDVRNKSITATEMKRGK